MKGAPNSNSSTQLTRNLSNNRLAHISDEIKASKQKTGHIFDSIE